MKRIWGGGGKTERENRKNKAKDMSKYLHISSSIPDEATQMGRQQDIHLPPESKNTGKQFH